MSLSVADSGSSSTTLISDTYLLWKNPGTSQPNRPGTSNGQRGSASRRSSTIGTTSPASPSSASPDLSSSSPHSPPLPPDANASDQNSALTFESKCPSILPISIPFPSTYRVDGRYWRLPPSFEATFLGIPALFVRCMYTLSVSITRTRSYHLASWTTSKT